MEEINFSKKLKEKFEFELAKYPEDQRISAVMASLTYAQDEFGGYLTDEVIKAVANYLRIPPVAAEEVATFYSMYEHKPVGRHKICVCNNISCKLRGSDKIISHLKKKLGVGFGEVTKDGKFSIKHVECLGACIGAPVVHIGDEYHEYLNEDKLDKILDELK